MAGRGVGSSFLFLNDGDAYVSASLDLSKRPPVRIESRCCGTDHLGAVVRERLPASRPPVVLENVCARCSQAQSWFALELDLLTPAGVSRQDPGACGLFTQTPSEPSCFRPQRTEHQLVPSVPSDPPPHIQGSGMGVSMPSSGPLKRLPGGPLGSFLRPA